MVTCNLVSLYNLRPLTHRVIAMRMMTASYSSFSSGEKPRPSFTAYRKTGTTSSTTTASDSSSDVPSVPSQTSTKVPNLPFPSTRDNMLANTSESIGDLFNDPSASWRHSFYGLSVKPFPEEIAKILLAPIPAEDIEIKPDGMLYLPEIKYRRILNRAFGPGGWGLVPRSEHSVSPRTISREYALVCHGRFVAQARGEQDYFDVNDLATAAEGCKSNALMRCCKDLGIASELWDPSFIRKFKSKYCVEVMTEHLTTKKRKKLWRLKTSKLENPYREI
jgi:hypothetical protein